MGTNIQHCQEEKARYSFSTVHLQPDIKKLAIKGSGATIFSTLLSFLIQMTGTIVLARLLTPVDFGLITMVTTFSLLLQSVGFNGFTEAIIQRDKLDHPTVNTIFWINAGISLIFTLIFMALAPLIAKFYKEPRLVLITIVVSFSIFSSGLSVIHLALLKRKMDFKVTSVIMLASRMSSIVVSIVLALLGMGYWALVVGTVAGPLTMAIGGWLCCQWRPGLVRERTNVKPIVKFALNTYGNFTLNYSCRNLDNLLVGKYMGLQPLGFYKKAYDLFALSASQLTSPLSNVALAALSRFSNDHERFRQNYLNAVSVIAFIGMASSLALTIAAKDIILFLLGPRWLPSAEIFMFFGPGIGPMLIYSTHGWLHLSLGRADRWLRWGILELIVTAAFFVVGMSFGPSGVALAWTTSFYVLIGPALWYAGRPVSLKLTDLLSKTWRYFASAIIAGAICWAIFFSFNSSAVLFNNISTFLRIIISSTISISLYVLLTVVLFGSVKPVKQVFSLARQMLPVPPLKHKD